MSHRIGLPDDENYLKSILHPKKLVKVWRNDVRQKLRNQGIKDLYDYYDFNYNIEQNSKILSNMIINGDYRPYTPLIYSLEKKHGISRHMVIPSPADSLLLQVLTNKMRDRILKKQPSKNAFFSRDKSFITKSWQVNNQYGLWYVQWRNMQQKIFRFQKTFNYLVVTDITDYYDNIDFAIMKQNLLRILGDTPEVLINMVMKIIEGIAWRPKYANITGRILPTVNYDSIRLLAFSNLFYLDKILEVNTSSNFVRWMDDIVFGVETKEDGKKILSKISDRLRADGLSLNLSKTRILSSKDAMKEFMFKENIILDNLEGQIINGNNSPSIKRKLNKMLNYALNHNGLKNWDKISKRIIRIFSNLKYKKLLERIPNLYVEFPVLRDFITFYLREIGPSRKSFDAVLQVLNKMEEYDDIALFYIINLITDWEISTGKGSRKFLDEVDEFLKKHFRLRQSSYDFYCYLWFKSKYSSQKDLKKFIIDTSYIWNKYSFLRRQVISVLPRLYSYSKKWVVNLFHQEMNSGDINAASVAHQIEYFSKLSRIDNKIKFYIFPDKIQDIYPLPKFFVLCSVLNSDSLMNKKGFSNNVKKHITDPYYTKWIKHYFN